MEWFRRGAQVYDPQSRLADLWLPSEIKPMVRHRHERWDGTGYPDRLSENEIPLAARILCIADAFDALTRQEGDGDAYPVDVAVRIMARESGRAFDPDLIHLFLTRTIPRRLRQHRISSAAT